LWSFSTWKCQSSSDGSSYTNDRRRRHSTNQFVSLARRDFSVTVLLYDVEGLWLKIHSLQTIRNKNGNPNIPVHTIFPTMYGLKIKYIRFLLFLGGLGKWGKAHGVVKNVNLFGVLLHFNYRDLKNKVGWAIISTVEAA